MRRLSLWMRAHPVVGDSVIAVVLALIDLSAVASTEPHHFPQTHPVPFWAVFALTVVPLTFRRIRPMLSSYLVLAGGVLQVLTHGSDNNLPDSMVIRGADLAIGVALYTMVAYAGRRRALPYGLSVLVGTGVWLVWRIGLNRDAVFVGAACLMVYGFCWVLGEFTGARKAYHLAVEERLTLLESDRDAQARIAVAQERTRIARELHDVVAHAVSVMVVQADGAAYAMASPAGQDLARTAVRTIADTGREALGELRGLLEVLRSEGDEGGERTPQPSVAALPELVDRVTTTGLPVWLVFRGDLAGLPAAVGLGIYRIVQEALTNTLKHAAAGSSAQVRVERVGNLVEVEVSDGPARDDEPVPALPSAPVAGVPAVPAARIRPVGVSGGNGLIGMRERATVLGGTLDAGPRPDGGWRVRATFPLKRREPDASLSA
jgi:signal transduction histidine kinase